MKKVVSLLLVLVMAVAVFAGCAKTDEKTIAVVAKGESHAFWQSVKAGAEAAGQKYGYKITFRGPASESPKDLPSQKEMVQTALSNKANALVLATIGTGFTQDLQKAFDSKIPVVQFDSGIWPDDVKALGDKNPIKSSVATSNLLAAALAADNFFAALKADIAATTEGKYVIGVIQHDETQTGIDRAKGFMDQFVKLADADATTKGKYEIKLEVKPGDGGGTAYKEALEALTQKGAKAIFMCNEGVVKQVFDAIGASQDTYKDVKFCGFDAGTKQIEWMKNKDGKFPTLVGSVAQDSFQIGYQAVEQAVFALEGKTVTANVAIAGAWWNKDNVDQMIKDNLVYEG